MGWRDGTHGSPLLSPEALSLMTVTSSSSPKGDKSAVSPASSVPLYLSTSHRMSAASTACHQQVKHVSSSTKCDSSAVCPASSVPLCLYTHTYTHIHTHIHTAHTHTHTHTHTIYTYVYNNMFLEPQKHTHTHVDIYMREGVGVAAGV